jgi:hypothetical protein
MWVRIQCDLGTIRYAELLSAFLRYDCQSPKRFHRDVNKMARSAWHEPMPDPAQPLLLGTYGLKFLARGKGIEGYWVIQNRCR